MSRKHRRDEFARIVPPPKRQQSRTTMVLLAAAFVLLVGASLLVMQRQSAGANSYADAGHGGDISFPLSDFADGQARFYTYTTALGKQIRFFVMRSADGVTRAAFDTCDVCFKERRGYRQQGSSMICNNCEQAFHSASINEVRGGCNPAPLERMVVGDRLVLRAASLEQGAFYF
jgi:uncharacterized membrane protein